jgi:FkbM family methyltransferase
MSTATAQHSESETLSYTQFNEALAQTHGQWATRKASLLELLDSKPLLLFGFGGKGQTLAHQIRQITGQRVTVFDSSKHKRDLARAQGFATVDSLTSESAGQWAVVLASGQVQLEQRDTVGRNYVFHQEVANLLKVPALENLHSEYEDFVLANSEALYKVYASLHPASQARFLAVQCFRLSGTPEVLQYHRQPMQDMWLDLPARYRTRSYHSFLDVGAYDGDTLRYFQERFGCERGIAVEANPELFPAIKAVATHYPKGIQIMPVAAWSKKTRLRFDDVRFGMIQVTESVDGQLEAAPIDDYVAEPIDCLKMDIEGAEAHALNGSAALLRAHRPDLAIAAYHKPGDLVELHRHIKDLGYDDSDFDWHFGHYSDCIDDSIFFVLRKPATSV